MYLSRLGLRPFFGSTCWPMASQQLTVSGGPYNWVLCSTCTCSTNTTLQYSTLYYIFHTVKVFATLAICLLENLETREFIVALCNKPLLYFVIYFRFYNFMHILFVSPHINKLFSSLTLNPYKQTKLLKNDYVQLKA